MLISNTKRRENHRITDDQGYILCYKCKRFAEPDAFNPITEEIPEQYLLRKEPDWEALFREYRPEGMKMHKTTYAELATVWNITAATIGKYVNKGRINADGNTWYIVAYPWEQQHFCIDCREPITVEENQNQSIEDINESYERLLSAA